MKVARGSNLPILDGKMSKKGWVRSVVRRPEYTQDVRFFLGPLIVSICAIAHPRDVSEENIL